MAEQHRDQNALRLSRISPEHFALESDRETDEPCAVLVTEEDGRPAAGVKVRYEILGGPLRFPQFRGRSFTVETDRRGRCAPSVEHTEKGASMVIVEILGDRSQAVVFQGHTEGTSDRLFIYAPSDVEASQGEIPVSVSAVDLNGDTVTDAELSLRATLPEHIEIEGELKRDGALYTGVLKTNRSGCWTVSVGDRLTRAWATANVCVRPGAPKEIQVLGDPDPRVRQPYNVVMLRSRLVDEFGNALSPTRISCKVEDKKVEPRALLALEAEYMLDATGYKTLNVILRDTESDVENRVEIPCAAAWIGSPGVVISGETYSSPVFLTPAPGASIREASISIQYDRKQASYGGFRGVGGSGLETVVEHSRGKLEITVTSDSPLSTRSHPEGIFIGDLSWQCLSPGKTCVHVVASMSPPTRPWEKCTDQKEDLRKTVCVNLIYNRDDPRLRDLSSRRQDVKRRLERIYNDSDTIKTCCPFITFTVNTTGLRGADWKRKVLVPARVSGTDGSGTLAPGDLTSTLGKIFQGVLGTTEGIRARCINFYLVDFGPRRTESASTKKGSEPIDASNPNSPRYGVGVIDPDNVLGDTTPHEVGHALGMDDDPPPPALRRNRDELMNNNPDRRTDTKITRKKDCIEVWRNIDAYGT